MHSMLWTAGGRRRLSVKFLSMTRTGYRFTPIILLASFLALGCCRDIPSDQLAKYPRMRSPSQIDGIYPGRAPSEGVSDLWEILTGQSLEDRPGQIRQIRVRAVGDDSLNVVRMMNGVEVERKDVHCSFEDGYIRLNRSLFHSNVEMTHIGCLEIAMATGKNDGEIAVYRVESFWAFWCLIIPVPADPLPRWDVFRAEATTKTMPSK
jgi:hypothetical protein